MYCFKFESNQRNISLTVIVILLFPMFSTYQQTISRVFFCFILFNISGLLEVSQLQGFVLSRHVYE